MNNEIFPEIVFRKEFSDFAEDPFVQALDFIQGKNDGFKGKYAATEAANLLKYRDFRKICDALNAEGITRFIPVKGMFVFNTIFSDYLGLRGMSDIDLLFAPEEYRKLKIFLKNHPEFPPSHGKHSFRDRRFEDIDIISGKTLTELHSQITNVAICGLINEIFENIEETADASGIKMLVPKIEYALVIMLMHDYTMPTLVNFSVRRLIEFYILLSHADMSKLREIAEKFDLDRTLDMQLFMIWTMLEKTFFPKNSFKIREEFGFIETNRRGFHVKHPWKIHSKIFHGKSLPLGIRSCIASLLRETKIGLKFIDMLHR